ncbi:hypothetical protein DMUE_1927 [Dictyocoela muelleri]|nr:hypothetical protein DMUE_1927 [Dictyocoela muelleri]
MFFLRIILFLILIKSEHLIKNKDFEEIKGNSRTFKIFSEKFINTSEMFAYVINEYNINIENEYPELHSIKKLYENTNNDIKELIGLIHTHISTQGHIFCAHLADENHTARIVSEFETSKQKYHLIIQEISNSDLEEYQNSKIEDIQSYFDFFIVNFYPNFLNLVKNIKIENNAVFFHDIRIFKEFYELLNDFLDKTANTLDIFSSNGKNNDSLSTLKVLITNIKITNESFFKLYIELYSFANLKNRLCVLFNNEIYDELKNKIIKVENSLFEIKTFNYSMNYPSKIKTMVECMNFEANALLLNLFILINKLNISEYEDEFPSSTQISILKSTFNISFNTFSIFKKLIPQIFGGFLAETAFLSRVLNISSMNEDINNCLYMLCKDSDYMKIPKNYYEEIINMIILHVQKIAEKNNEILHLYDLKENLKLNFNYISENCEKILTLMPKDSE